MALKPCLFCGNEISDTAVQCPKCKQWGPFDISLRKELDHKELKEKAKGELINCEVCGKPVAARKFLRSSIDANGCENCGHMQGIPCSICGEPSIDYIPDREGFFCSNHIIVGCEWCHSHVYSEDSVCHMIAHCEYKTYCRKCFKRLYGVYDPKEIGEPRGCCIPFVIFFLVSSTSILFIKTVFFS